MNSMRVPIIAACLVCGPLILKDLLCKEEKLQMCLDLHLCDAAVHAHQWIRTLPCLALRQPIHLNGFPNAQKLHKRIGLPELFNKVEAHIAVLRLTFFGRPSKNI